MKPRVTIRPQADRDLVEQAQYFLTKSGMDTALKFYDAAEETFSLLASSPEMGRPRKHRNPRLTGLRVCLVLGFPKHLVFYRPTRRTIEVVRVLHGAQDVDSLIEL